MDLDEELDTMEDGAETEAEQTDEETELQDLEDFEDEGLGVDAEETDLEDAYEEFYYSEEGPEGEGESSDAGDGGLATMDAGETAELGGMGFHLVDEEEARATEDLVDEASGEEGAIRDYDGFAAVSYTHLDVYKRQRGVWVEICTGSPMRFPNSRHSPHGECGLKLQRRCPEAWRLQSLPARGVWVEITSVCVMVADERVTPRTGSVG